MTVWLCCNCCTVNQLKFFDRLLPVAILQEPDERTGSVNAPRRPHSQVSFPSDADTIDTNSSSIDDPDLNDDDTPVLLIA